MDIISSKVKEAEAKIKDLQDNDGDKLDIANLKGTLKPLKSTLAASKKTYAQYLDYLTAVEEGNATIALFKREFVHFKRVFLQDKAVCFELDIVTEKGEFVLVNGKKHSTECSHIISTNKEEGIILSFAQTLPYFALNWFASLDNLATEIQSILDYEAAKQRAKNAGVRDMFCTIKVGELKSLLMQGDGATHGILSKEYKTVALFGSGRFVAGYEAAAEGFVQIEGFSGDMDKAIHIPVNIGDKALTKTVAILEGFKDNMTIKIGNYSLIDPQGEYRESKFYLDYGFGKGELKLNDQFVKMADAILREVKEVGTTASIEMASSELRKVVNTCAKFVSNDELRPAMCGIYFDVENMCAVATNAHILVKHTLKLVKSDVGFKAIVPVLAVQDWLKAIPLDSKENVSIAIKANGKAEFICGDKHLVIRLICANYVAYKDVIPTKNDKVLEVLKGDFIRTVKTMQSYAQQDTKQIILTMRDGRLDLDVKDLYWNNAANLALPCSFSAEPMRACFNHFYLLEVVSTVAGNKVAMSFSNGKRAALVEDGEKLMIIMPCMLEDKEYIVSAQ